MAGTEMALGFVLLLFLFVFSIIGFAIFCFVFWILMIVDVVQRKFKESNEQIVWALVIIFAGIIGALIYYFIVKRKNKH